MKIRITFGLNFRDGRKINDVEALKEYLEDYSYREFTHIPELKKGDYEGPAASVIDEWDDSEDSPNSACSALIFTLHESQIAEPHPKDPHFSPSTYVNNGKIVWMEHEVL